MDRRLKMPIFEYQCKTCGHVTAFLEKAGKTSGHTCEKCGSKETEKVFSTFAARGGGLSSSSGDSSCPTGTCPLN